MSTYTVKKQKWIVDTKIARKLYNVLEDKDGQILIEYDEVVSGLSYDDINSAIQSLKSKGCAPDQILVSPTQYKQLLTHMQAKMTYSTTSTRVGSTSSMSLLGVEVKESKYVEYDRLLFVNNKGNK